MQAPRTTVLLACGTVAGPLFVAVALVQAAARPGFDLRRHPFSLLSLGTAGWIQIVNFVLCGALFVACAAGMRRVLRHRPAGTWGPLLTALFGLGSIGGGVFVADPALGFPAGAAPTGAAAATWHGTAHGFAFMVGMTALVAAFFTMAYGFAAAGDRRWSRGSLAAGIAFVALAAAGTGIGDWRLVALAVAIGWGWVSLVAVRLRAPAPDGGRVS
ncbi:DUF998 domain-containing protein [Dactylosporangium cerinum]|uniref:DUF998 domain-containing protein n=1 Tax=Dactylosporangium cerinum TaxID=1434730 RepID=A0ABV9VT15_9ACTN